MLLSYIPTETFNKILEDLCSEGWTVISEYDGFDAWIDYGNVVIRNGETGLVFEWDNWSEGCIWSEGNVEGPDSLLEELQKKYGLRVRESDTNKNTP